MRQWLQFNELAYTPIVVASSYNNTVAIVDAAPAWHQVRRYQETLSLQKKTNKKTKTKTKKIQNIKKILVVVA